MNTYINGTDITQYVDVIACEYTDAGDGESDRIELLVRNTTDFNAWKPARGDRLRVFEGAIDSGELAIDIMWPGPDGYRMVATAMPEGALDRAYQSYNSATLGDIAERLAARLGLKAAYYGINPAQAFKYCARDDMTIPQFLEWIATPQAGVVKFAAGKLILIGLEWAKNQTPRAAIELRQDASNFENAEIPAAKLRQCTVSTPKGRGTAYDDDAETGAMVINHVPVFSAIEAQRWARGALYRHNRRASELRAYTDLAPQVYAMAACRTVGAIEDLWIADTVTHDLKNGRTEIVLRR